MLALIRAECKKRARALPSCYPISCTGGTKNHCGGRDLPFEPQKKTGSSPEAWSPRSAASKFVYTLGYWDQRTARNPSRAPCPNRSWVQLCTAPALQPIRPGMREQTGRWPRGQGCSPAHSPPLLVFDRVGSSPRGFQRCAATRRTLRHHWHAQRVDASRPVHRIPLHTAQSAPRPNLAHLQWREPTKAPRCLRTPRARGLLEVVESPDVHRQRWVPVCDPTVA